MLWEMIEKEVRDCCERYAADVVVLDIGDSVRIPKGRTVLLSIRFEGGLHVAHYWDVVNASEAFCSIEDFVDRYSERAKS